MSPQTVAPAFVWPVRVYWEDTDAGGVVFFANYLKFFERARTEWLRGLGVNQQRMRQDHGVVLVVTHSAVRYHRSARLDDELRVTVSIRQIGRASVEFEQQAWRGDELLAESEIRVGCVSDSDLRPARIPAPVYQVIASPKPSAP